MTFVDIAGLVKGASKGEGLGNQFLANIRETDAIAHVLRCFDNGDVTHVEGKVDPVADAETIETELMLADIESIEKRLQNLSRKIRGGDKEAIEQDRLLKLALDVLGNGQPARTLDIVEDDLRAWNMLQLLTAKPVLYVCNVDEENAASAHEAACVVISAAIEEEISQLDTEEAKLFLDEMGLNQPGLNRLIEAGYNLLDLQTYFTCGPKETRAWTVQKGVSAPQAAGVIHGDFEKGFIRAETIAFEDYIDLGGESAARDAGKLRAEGKSYIVQDGDVMHFLHSN